jgi:hypothetical protein
MLEECKNCNSGKYYDMDDYSCKAQQPDKEYVNHMGYCLDKTVAINDFKYEDVQNNIELNEQESLIYVLIYYLQIYIHFKNKYIKFLLEKKECTLSIYNYFLKYSSFNDLINIGPCKILYPVDEGLYFTILEYHHLFTFILYVTLKDKLNDSLKEKLLKGMSEMECGPGQSNEFFQHKFTLSDGYRDLMNIPADISEDILNKKFNELYEIISESEFEELINSIIDEYLSGINIHSIMDLIDDQLILSSLGGVPGGYNVFEFKYEDLLLLLCLVENKKHFNLNLKLKEKFGDTNYSILDDLHTHRTAGNFETYGDATREFQNKYLKYKAKYLKLKKILQEKN